MISWNVAKSSDGTPLWKSNCWNWLKLSNKLQINNLSIYGISFLIQKRNHSSRLTRMHLFWKRHKDHKKSGVIDKGFKGECNYASLNWFCKSNNKRFTSIVSCRFSININPTVIWWMGQMQSCHVSYFYLICSFSEIYSSLIFRLSRDIIHKRNKGDPMEKENIIFLLTFLLIISVKLVSIPEYKQN